jgi:hypothetical protein
MISVSGDVTASYTYDGDGQRIKATEDGVTTIFVGSYYEYSVGAGTAKKYYYSGATRLAMRDGNGDLN